MLLQMGSQRFFFIGAEYQKIVSADVLESFGIAVVNAVLVLCAGEESDGFFRSEIVFFEKGFGERLLVVRGPYYGLQRLCLNAESCQEITMPIQLRFMFLGRGNDPGVHAARFGSVRIADVGGVRFDGDVPGGAMSERQCF